MHGPSSARRAQPRFRNRNLRHRGESMSPVEVADAHRKQEAEIAGKRQVHVCHIAILVKVAFVYLVERFQLKPASTRQHEAQY